MTHPPEELLIQHVLGLESQSDHLDHCARCLEVVEELRAGMQTASPAPMPSSLSRFASSLEDDAEKAKEIIAEIDEEGSALLDHDVFWTEGGMIAASEWVVRLSRSEPSRAMALSNALLGRREEASEELQVELFRVAAVCARTLGAYVTARAHLDRAESLAENLPVSDYALARIWYQRALVASNTKSEEPLTLWAGKAAEVFERFGDEVMATRCRYVITSAQYLARNYGSALHTADQILETARTHDPQTRGATLMMRGWAGVYLDEFQIARDSFSEAKEVFESLEFPIEISRADWGEGLGLLRLGEMDEARDRFERALQSFSSMGLVEEASLIRLDLAELNLIEKRPEEARALVRKAIAGLNGILTTEDAQRALAYLREAALTAESLGAVNLWLHQHVENPGLAPASPAIFM